MGYKVRTLNTIFVFGGCRWVVVAAGQGGLVLQPQLWRAGLSLVLNACLSALSALSAW